MMCESEREAQYGRPVWVGRGRERSRVGSAKVGSGPRLPLLERRKHETGHAGQGNGPTEGSRACIVNGHCNSLGMHQRRQAPTQTCALPSIQPSVRMQRCCCEKGVIQQRQQVPPWWLVLPARQHPRQSCLLLVSNAGPATC